MCIPLRRIKMEFPIYEGKLTMVKHVWEGLRLALCSGMPNIEKWKKRRARNKPTHGFQLGEGWEASRPMKREKLTELLSNKELGEQNLIREINLFSPWTFVQTNLKRTSSKCMFLAIYILVTKEATNSFMNPCPKFYNFFPLQKISYM